MLIDLHADLPACWKGSLSVITASAIRDKEFGLFSMFCKISLQLTIILIPNFKLRIKTVKHKASHGKKTHIVGVL